MSKQTPTAIITISFVRFYIKQIIPKIYHEKTTVPSRLAILVGRFGGACRHQKSIFDNRGKVNIPSCMMTRSELFFVSNFSLNYKVLQED